MTCNRCVVLAAGLIAFGAQAQPSAATPHYAGYVLGLHVFDMTLAVSLQRNTYSIESTFRLSGALGALWHAEGAASARGSFDDDRARPQEMASDSRYGGEAHALRMVWRNGLPDMVRMVPPMEKDREPVPVRDQADTVDTLSAVAALTRHVAQTGRCDTTMRLYEGSLLITLTSQGAAHVLLKPTALSSFQGDALRCDLTARVTDGFLRHDDNAEQRRPRAATIWFASVSPQNSPIPVLMKFHQPGSPEATVYLL